MGMGKEDVANAPPREGGAVPDGIPSGDRQPSVPEHLRQVTLEQLSPFHGSGVTPRLLPLGAYKLPEAAL